MALRTDLFDYDLPEHLIAQHPAARRDQSRLLVVDRARRTVAHHGFADLPQFLRADDRVFRNTASVLPARLFAQRPAGGRVECFLLRPEGRPNHWWCLLRPGKKLPVGARFAAAHGAFSAEVLAKTDDGAGLIAFATPQNEPIVAVAGRLGEVPLPLYIHREHTPGERADDRERYETVYADRTRPVAVAAPTAGLHFTPELLAGLARTGVRFGDLTLHVGLGTFRMIQTATIEEHPIHREIYEIPAATQALLFAKNGRRVAVGTTTVRTLEHFLKTHAAPAAGTCLAEADIYLYPPRIFRGVDALITNFHQPRSTLLCLVAAFLTPGSTDGIGWIREIYADAIARDYRFFSYGDAMLIL